MIALLLISGLVLLYFGAEGLVRGASALALRFGISPLVIGLTVVAFGTSAPELVVSVDSALKGLGNIAVGNVVGSNIFNIAVILGISAMIRPMRVKVQLIRIDVPIMIGVTLLLLVFLLDLKVVRYEGVVLTLGIISYLVLSFVLSRKAQMVEGDDSEKPKSMQLIPAVLFVIAGLGLLILGARFLVSGAVDLARLLGISEAVIGLTIVAAGTSLPELATSVVASAKGEDDISIGNIVGSNVFNILAILGISSIVKPLESSGIELRDLLMMFGTAVILFPLMYSRFVISRLEGLLLAALYGGYLFLLWPR